VASEKPLIEKYLALRTLTRRKFVMDFHPLDLTKDGSNVSAYAHLDRYVG
jgi:hypothetical protein